MIRRSPARGALLASLLAACFPDYALTGAQGDGGGDATSPPDATTGDASVSDSGGQRDGPSFDATSDGSSLDAGSGCLGTRGSSMVRFDVPGGKGSFCIDRFEVTNGDFNAYLIDANAMFDAPPLCDPERSGQVPKPTPVYHVDMLPVVNIGWCDAWSYCKWAGKRLCAKVGVDAGHADDSGDISNEWEYVCRNGLRVTDYPYGIDYQGGVCNIPDPDAGLAMTLLADAGTFTGCHGIDAGFDQVFDMSGNVAEMDDWSQDYTNQNDANVSVHTRGGSYQYAFLAACTGLFAHPVLQTYGDVGFRCCADVAP
jgi:formylglycine-generating enzyme required for sulfatase activity